MDCEWSTSVLIAGSGFRWERKPVFIFGGGMGLGNSLLFARFVLIPGRFLIPGGGPTGVWIIGGKTPFFVGCLG